MKLGKAGRFVKRLMDRYRYNDSKKLFACYMILHTMVVLTAIRCLITHNYESFAICILTLVLFLLPALVEEYMDLTIPPLFQTIIFLFIFSAEILGEVNSYYVKTPGWDTMLHTMNGFLCAAIGFSLVYLLNRGSRNVNLIGAVVFSVIGYVTLKKSKTSKVAEKFMIKPNVHEEE